VVEWRDHEGVRYLYTSYAVSDPAEAVQVTHRAFELTMAEPAGSLVRSLVDVRGGLHGGWDRSGLKEAREQIRAMTDHLRLRVAIIGVSGVMGALIRGMTAVSGGYTVVPCPSEEKALAYLMRE
jgi:hypothetical protein